MERRPERYSDRAILWGPDATLALAAAVAPLIAMMLLLPKPLVLPVIAFLSIGGAAVLALFAKLTFMEIDPRKVTLWDLSGACALIGIAAGIFSDAEQIVEAFASITQQIRR